MLFVSHLTMPTIQLGFAEEPDVPLTYSIDDFPNKVGGKPVCSSCLTLTVGLVLTPRLSPEVLAKS